MSVAYDIPFSLLAVHTGRAEGSPLLLHTRLSCFRNSLWNLHNAIRCQLLAHERHDSDPCHHISTCTLPDTTIRPKAC